MKSQILAIYYNAIYNRIQKKNLLELKYFFRYFIKLEHELGVYISPNLFENFSISFLYLAANLGSNI